MPRKPEPRLTVELDGEEVAVTVRRSNRARRVRIRVGDFGAEVVLPTRAAYRHAMDAVRIHGDWILSQLRRVKRDSDAIEQDGGRFLFRGTWTNGHELGATVGCANPAEIEKWLRREARVAIQQAVRDWSRAMDVEPKRLGLRDQKTKWGACSAKGSVTFNWRLIMAPPEILEYVVIHELAHLKELNHSPRFWAVVERHCPDWRNKKAWLKQNGRLLKLPSGS